MPAQKSVRLIQREVRVGDVRVEYCAARRRGGDWFALGTVIQKSGAPDAVNPVISGLGTTELLAVEQMMRGVTERRQAVVATG